MILKRDRNARGAVNTGWLDSKHSFSFGHYHDPDHMGFGPLRVINEDRVIPGAGFEEHGHRNMEIITYVLKGALAHKDSMGNGSTMKPGDIQIMSAGSGVRHSEFNDSQEDEVHLLQIWIMPNVENQAPDYQQKYFAPSELENSFRVVVSPNGEKGSLTMKQDAKLLAGKLEEGHKTSFQAALDRKYWVQIAQGKAEINAHEGAAGDGFAITEEDTISITALTQSEILLFDLPA